jgi:hypothetical protein
MEEAPQGGTDVTADHSIPLPFLKWAAEAYIAGRDRLSSVDWGHAPKLDLWAFVGSRGPFGRPGELARGALRWAMDTFGADAGGVEERATRFLEEALELGQACGVTWKRADRLVERAYRRRIALSTRGQIADQRQELGQAAFTLEALGAALGQSPLALAGQEFERVKGMDPEILRKSHREKVARGEAGPEPQEQDTKTPPEPIAASPASFDPRRPFTTRHGKRAYVARFGEGYEAFYADPSEGGSFKHFYVDFDGRCRRPGWPHLDLVNTDVSEPALEVNPAPVFDAFNSDSVLVRPARGGGYDVLIFCGGSIRYQSHSGGSDQPHPSPSPPPPSRSVPRYDVITRWANIYETPWPTVDGTPPPGKPKHFTVGDLFSTCYECELAGRRRADLVARVCVEFCPGDGL